MAAARAAAEKAELAPVLRALPDRVEELEVAMLALQSRIGEVLQAVKNAHSDVSATVDRELKTLPAAVSALFKLAIADVEARCERAADAKIADLIRRVESVVGQLPQ